MNRLAEFALEPRPIDPLPAAAAQLPPPVAIVETEPAPGRYATVVAAGEPFSIRARALAPPRTGPLRGVVRWRAACAPHWQEEPLLADGENGFHGSWIPPVPGDYEWTVELWLDDDMDACLGDSFGIRHGSSGADALHYLRAERPELTQSRWTRAARRPLLELIHRAPADSILLLPPIFAQTADGEIGRDGMGHYTIDPALGSAAEFGQLSAALRAQNTPLAMTLPLRCSPQHPFRQRDPDAFRADGTPDLLGGDWPHRWEAWEAVFRFWLVQGIELFHIPHPHTAPVAFWEHLIDNLRQDFPYVAFSFTPEDAPALRPHLVGAGFWCADTAHPPPLEPTPEPTIPVACSSPDMRASLTTSPCGRMQLRVENLHPERAACGHIHLDGAALGLSEHERYYLRDTDNGRAYRWSGTTNFLVLDADQTAVTFHIERP